MFVTMNRLLVVVSFVIAFLGMAVGQCLSRYPQYVSVDSSSPISAPTDVNTLLQLASLINKIENDKSDRFTSDDIITKLIDALILVATRTNCSGKDLLNVELGSDLLNVSEAQCLARRSWAPCNYDDVNVLITLARALEESENSRSCRNNIDVEEIIMKLINALVYTTIGNQNGCGGSGGNGGSVSTPNEGLIDLDLLNPNDPDNILKLDLARQKLLGIGLGNTN